MFDWRCSRYVCFTYVVDTGILPALILFCRWRWCRCCCCWLQRNVPVEHRLITLRCDYGAVCCVTLRYRCLRYGVPWVVLLFTFTVRYWLFLGITILRCTAPLLITVLRCLNVVCCDTFVHTPVDAIYFVLVVFWFTLQLLLPPLLMMVTLLIGIVNCYYILFPIVITFPIYIVIHCSYVVIHCCYCWWCCCYDLLRCDTLLCSTLLLHCCWFWGRYSLLLLFLLFITVVPGTDWVLMLFVVVVPLQCC